MQAVRMMPFPRVCERQSCSNYSENTSVQKGLNAAAEPGRDEKSVRAVVMKTRKAMRVSQTTQQRKDKQMSYSKYVMKSSSTAILTETPFFIEFFEKVAHIFFL